MEQGWWAAGPAPLLFNPLVLEGFDPRGSQLHTAGRSLRPDGLSKASISPSMGHGRHARNLPLELTLGPLAESWQDIIDTGSIESAGDDPMRQRRRLAAGTGTSDGLAVSGETLPSGLFAEPTTVSPPACTLIGAGTEVQCAMPQGGGEELFAAITLAGMPSISDGRGCHMPGTPAEAALRSG